MIELSLGLSCGGSSVKQKSKNSSSLDIRTNGDDEVNKIHDNFFNNISQPTSNGDAPARELWVASDSGRSAETEEEKSDQHDPRGKRKMLFDEMIPLKKHDKQAHDATGTSLHNGIAKSAKISHITSTMEDGFTVENEDVAESEVEGSTLRLVSHLEESTKQYADSTVVRLERQKISIPSENEFKPGNITYGYPIAGQQLNVPFSFSLKGSNPVCLPGTSDYNLPGFIQLASPNEERAGPHPANSGNFPLAFGHSHVQLPTLDKEHNWVLGSNPHHFPPLNAGKGTGCVTPSPESNNDELKLPQGKVGDDEQHVPEEGLSSYKGDDAKGSNNAVFRSNDASDQVMEVASSHECSAIRPGVFANVKFGGCGSYPNLPWVSTTGLGPNGKTISGVTYRLSKNQIKIVCACHGAHLTPEEFVRHASDENAAGPDGSTASPSLPSSNPAASAQS